MATTAAAATLGMGVGAYKAHESAGEIKSDATAFEAAYHDPAATAEMKGLAHTKDLQTIFLLGGAVLLGAGTAAAGYGESTANHKTRQTMSRGRSARN